LARARLKGAKVRQQKQESAVFSTDYKEFWRGGGVDRVQKRSLLCVLVRRRRRTDARREADMWEVPQSDFLLKWALHSVFIQGKFAVMHAASGRVLRAGIKNFQQNMKSGFTEIGQSPVGNRMTRLAIRSCSHPSPSPAKRKAMWHIPRPSLATPPWPFSFGR